MRFLTLSLLIAISSFALSWWNSSDFENGLGYCAGVYGKKKDYKKASKIFEKIIKKGESDPNYFSTFGRDKSAYGLLCEIYYDGGPGVKKDYKKALKICKKGAKVNDDYSLFILGRMYETGAGVETNHKTSAKWYEKAAKAGSLGAMYNLGNIYYYGEGNVPVNKVKAYKYWKKCALSDNGNAETIALCQKKLGVLCKSDPWVCKR